MDEVDNDASTSAPPPSPPPDPPPLQSLGAPVAVLPVDTSPSSSHSAEHRTASTAPLSSTPSALAVPVVLDANFDLPPSPRASSDHAPDSVATPSVTPSSPSVLQSYPPTGPAPPRGWMKALFTLKKEHAAAGRATTVPAASATSEVSQGRLAERCAQLRKVLQERDQECAALRAMLGSLIERREDVEARLLEAAADVDVVTGGKRMLEEQLREASDKCAELLNELVPLRDEAQRLRDFKQQADAEKELFVAQYNDLLVQSSQTQAENDELRRLYADCRPVLGVDDTYRRLFNGVNTAACWAGVHLHDVAFAESVLERACRHHDSDVIFAALFRLHSSLWRRAVDAHQDVCEWSMAAVGGGGGGGDDDDVGDEGGAVLDVNRVAVDVEIVFFSKISRRSAAARHFVSYCRRMDRVGVLLRFYEHVNDMRAHMMLRFGEVLAKCPVAADRVRELDAILRSVKDVYGRRCDLLTLADVIETIAQCKIWHESVIKQAKLQATLEHEREALAGKLRAPSTPRADPKRSLRSRLFPSSASKQQRAAADAARLEHAGSVVRELLYDGSANAIAPSATTAYDSAELDRVVFPKFATARSSTDAVVDDDFVVVADDSSQPLSTKERLQRKYGKSPKKPRRGSAASSTRPPK